ncbi:MAG: efflux RND transporter periplasmic adaptor subunit [Pseudomonadales bacterium]|nr:efflux RND transporter periplasmic adaptor subunit [Pseudomonadales bacterium]
MKPSLRPILLALGLTIAVIVWMMSGLVGDASTPVPDVAATQSRHPLMSVAVSESQARPVTREVVISARTEPNRRVDLAAEIEGRVVSIDAERGAWLVADQRIVGLDQRDLKTRITEAQALIAQREIEYQGAQRLRGREFMSEAQIAEANARLASAKAALEGIQLDMQRTVITAPFAAVLEDRSVELGNYVGIGDTIATLVDTDPLIAVGEVSERDIHQLDTGSQGQATLLGGAVVTGTVRYVAPVASESTRSFQVELAIPNPQGQLRAGMSAEVRLPAGEVRGHRITPALLAQDAEGNIGIKTVDARNTVQFFPVEIFSSGSEGIWVTGLPEQVTMIVVGQGFVIPGDTVNPVYQDATTVDEGSGP